MSTDNPASSNRPTRTRLVPDDAGSPTAPGSADRSWVIALAGAALTFVFGVIVLAWPSATLSVIAILLGIQLLAFGIIRLIAGVTNSYESGGMRAATVVLGLLGIAAGLYCIRHLSVTVGLLAFLVGLFWAIYGIVDLVVAITAGPVPGRLLKAAVGVISLVAGLVVMFEPKASLTFLLVVLGVYLVIYGLLMAVWALHDRRSQHRLADKPHLYVPSRGS
jgi:uncharacterized membrane protein HdeD (DUF308 family)